MIRKMGCPNPYTRYSSIECNKVYSKLIRNDLYKFKYGNTFAFLNKNKENKEIIETFLGNGETIMSIANAGAEKPNIFLIVIIFLTFITLLVLMWIYNI